MKSLNTCLLIIACLVGSMLCGESSTLEQAHNSYKKGEAADNFLERSQAFNQSLTLYKTLEKRSQNPNLLYNIGNNYYQLSEYSWARWYYERALLQSPRNEKILYNLALTKEKLGLNEEKNFLFSAPLLNLSIYEKSLLLVLFFAFAVLLNSINLCLSKKKIVYSLQISILLCLITCMSLVYDYYLAPVQGIVMHASNLHRDAGAHYALVQDDPVLEGTRLRVLGIDKESSWVQVLTLTGEIAYLPQESIRLVD